MPSDGKEIAEFRAIALRAAELAGEIVLPLFQSALTVELKADRTPVTVADRRAEEAIRAFLTRECPGHGIVGEEFGESPGDGRHRWILDPIDGTKSYVHGVPLFGTLVALERDGEPIVGVIACHALGETVVGGKGLGTQLNGRPVSVSKVASLGQAAVSTTSAVRLEEMHPEGWRRLGERARLVRTWGDCYGYLLVATGRIEAMLDPEMNLWDVAALWPVIREAGGELTDWQGRPRAGESVIASNGAIHSELLGTLQD